MDRLYIILNYGFSRILVYGLLTIVSIASITLSSTNEHVAEISEKIFENKYWPIVIGLYELFRNHVNKYFQEKSQTIIENTRAVITAGVTDRDHLLTVISGRDKEITTKYVDEYFNEKIGADNPFKK